MTRYFLKLAYNGANYHGWQYQPNGVSVQEVLTKCLSLQLKSEIEITGCGRTDTGVHALEYYAHFDFNKYMDDSECKSMVHKLNSFLPSDIVIYDFYVVHENLHARFSAQYRTYRYYLHTAKDPFKNSISFYFYQPLDFLEMNSAAEELLKFADFSSFSKANTNTITNNCKIEKAEWIKYEDHAWYFEIKANRFLRNMVRAIVGTLLDVGTGKINSQDFCNIIEAKNRSEAGTSVKPHALFLYKVEY